MAPCAGGLGQAGEGQEDEDGEEAGEGEKEEEAEEAEEAEEGEGQEPQQAALSPAGWRGWGHSGPFERPGWAAPARPRAGNPFHQAGFVYSPRRKDGKKMPGGGTKSLYTVLIFVRFSFCWGKNQWSH